MLHFACLSQKHFYLDGYTHSHNFFNGEITCLLSGGKFCHNQLIIYLYGREVCLVHFGIQQVVLLQERWIEFRIWIKVNYIILS